MVPLSILDLVPIVTGATARTALHDSLDFARHAEALGYRRFWVAEHHNMTGIASAATSVVIGFLAQGTSRIRIGAGGIMLPNHAPLVVAEQFGTLESLYPGRIDLALGRAPGADQRTLRALRRDPLRAEDFPQDVRELQGYFAPAEAGQAVRAVPGAGLNVPLWILGSSTFGSGVAAAMGLPYAFASHFAPDALLDALSVYRTRFRPSPQLDQPYAMAGLTVVAADTDAEARRLFTTMQQAFVNHLRGQSGPYPPPVDDISPFWSGPEAVQAQHMLRYAMVGSRDTVRDHLEKFVAMTHIDELIIVSPIYDPAARRRSLDILAELALA